MVESFDLDPPPNFKGLDPHLPVKFYTRNLPHWRQDGATYAVTFRLADSLPKEKLDLLISMRRHWELKYPEPRSENAWQQYARTVANSVHKWLDQGKGVCHFNKIEFAKELARSILHFQETRYFVCCFTIMPNHCHLVIRPNQGIELEEVIGAIKGVVSRFVNSANGTQGTLWQQESFDRIIRDEEHLYRVVQYVGNNPRTAGLNHREWRRWIHPAWDENGWGFREV